MRVTLLAFGVLRDHLAAGLDGRSLDLPAGATVRDLIEVCEILIPTAPIPWSAIAVAVNREYAGQSHPLADGDEVALLPPVSGGAAEPAAPVIRLIHEKIVPRDIVPP